MLSFLNHAQGQIKMSHLCLKGTCLIEVVLVPAVQLLTCHVEVSPDRWTLVLGAARGSWLTDVAFCSSGEVVGQGLLSQRSVATAAVYHPQRQDFDSLLRLPVAPRPFIKATNGSRGSGALHHRKVPHRMVASHQALLDMI